ncbi:MAG: hypothetical protein ACJ748_09640 [Flavisolibacter sp.]
MQKIYRILRDNKETGPLTLEELVAMSLKPFDLIWVDGRSAGWRYPSEVEALKPYLGINENIENPQPSVSARLIHPASNEVRPEVIHEEIPLNQNMEEAEVLTSENIEKKAAEIYRRVQAYSEMNNREKEGTQTKYAKSLEDLKQEYADWLHTKKQKKKFSFTKKGLVFVGSLGCLIAAWFIFAGNKKTNGESEITEPNRYISNAVYLKDQQAATAELKDNSIRPQQKTSSGSIVRSGNKEQSVDQFIDSIERILDKQNLIVSGTRHKKHSKNINNIKADVGSAEEAPKLMVEKPDSKEVPLSELINMNAHYMYDTHQHLFGLEVTIQNKSRQLLKKVTVDVFYYKKGERLFDKETLYFNNIQPGNSFTLSTAGNKKAVSARFQLGQIIGEN